ncbi:uncharacterized protein LOC120309688 isoform X2 [Crotalus tigris]|uniref:uncharacterized protein LOC120307113 isoform X2 n=1 Tax=Crotalus tigris TaxID=88082 RepID=UPI00192F20B6|nr:uncharacterized protein LOC120307113 isoform X2 [Crotalus tigris]XP_039203121.1 uncharacterized protein LOC120309688 isoform X2 [Crotalus tigris]
MRGTKGAGPEQSLADARTQGSLKPSRRFNNFRWTLGWVKVRMISLMKISPATTRLERRFSSQKGASKLKSAPCKAACHRRDQRRSQGLCKEERSILEGLSSIATLFRLKRSGQMAVPKPRNKNLYGLAVLALMEDNNLSSFTARLAAMLAVYDISKVSPAMDPYVESQLLKISGSMWMSSMKNRGENISEEEKKLQ